MTGTELAKAYVQIVPSAKGIKGSISEALGGEASSAGNKAGCSLGGNLISTFKKVFVAAGIGKVISQNISEGANLEQSIGGVETLFKGSADTVKKYANEAYKAAGLSANDYMEQVTSFSASLLQSLDGDTDAAAKSANQAIIDMSDNANKMGTDIESIQNAYQGFAKQNYTMLDNLKLGYGGTKEEMQRLLTDAEKISGVKYDISNLDDVYTAIHVIQGELGVTGTTAEESAQTISGSLASMKASFSNVLGQLATGGDVTSALTTLGETVFTFVSGNLAPMVGRILAGLPEILKSTLSMVIQGLNLLEDNADTILQLGIDVITGIASAIISALPYLAEAAIGIITALGEAILNTDWAQIGTDLINGLKDSLSLASSEILGSDESIITSVCGSITNNLPLVLEQGVNTISTLVNGILSSLPLLIESAGKLITEFSGFILNNLPTILNAGTELLLNIVNGITNNLPQIVDAAIQVVSDFMDTVAEALPDILRAGVDLILNLVNGIIDNLPEIINAAVKAVAEFVAAIAKKLPDILQSGITLLGELIAGLISAIPDLIASIPQIISGIVDTLSEYDWLQLGADILTGIGNGIVNAVSSVIKAAKDAAKAIFDAVKSFFEIGSPSKLMRDEIGHWIPPGIAVGVEKNLDPLTDTMQEVTELTTGAWNKEIAQGLNENKKIFNKSTIAAGWNSVDGSGIVDYERMAGTIVDALVSGNVTISVSNREFGRLVNGVMA